MDIQNEEHNIEGALVMAPCDTPAAAWLGGFKISVGWAQKGCRTCDGTTRGNMKTEFREKAFNRRTTPEHKARCELLENLDDTDRMYFSRTWGIKDTSCLLKLHDFDLINGLVHDPMHVLLEGVVPKEMALLLEHCIYRQRYFDLKWLNNRIKSFKYSYLQGKAKPEPIDKKHIENRNIKQTSAAMLTLCENLGFIVASKIPEDDEHWINYLLLVQITLLCTSPVCESSTPYLLSHLVETHHENFRNLYPHESITPKFHYMIHFGHQMALFGPLRFSWCMRFEGKHSFFKGVKTHNFLNIPKTFARRHQRYMCHKQNTIIGEKSKSFLYAGDLVKEGKEINLGDLYPDICSEYEALMQCEDYNMYQSPHVEILGHVYKKGCMLVCSYDSEGLPVFSELADILIKDGNKLFVLEMYDIDYFDSHTGSFVVYSTGTMAIKKHKDLFSAWPLTKRVLEDKIYVVNKYSYKCEYIA